MFALQLGLAVGLVTLLGSVSAKKPRPQVLMLSFDGLRWDYPDWYDMTNFNEFRKEGVYVRKGVVSSFTTMTFPDHYTIATGLYEESHGIVGDRMYDPFFKENFTLKTTDPKWWDGGEPIWVTAGLQELSCASYYWPGSDVKLKNVDINFVHPYDPTVRFNKRMDTIVQWLEKKTQLVVAYFNEPDYSGHQFGALSQGLREAVKSVDDTLGYLIRKLKEKKLYDKVNILVVSGHGMTNVTLDKNHTIVLGEHLNMTQHVERIPLDGAVASIMPKKNQMEAVLARLRSVRNITVYKKEDIPDRYHYKRNRRIMDILAVADEGFFIVTNISSSNLTGAVTGQHGYDNRLPSMKPIFMARGPDFKKNYKSKEFETVDIYPLLCHLLGIKPAPNNGSLDKVKGMLSHTTRLAAYVGFLHLGLLGLIMVWCNDRL